MQQPEWDALVADVRDLQARVVRLEREVGVAAAASEAAATETRGGPVDTAGASGPPVLGDSSALFPVIGRALLGLAGAYLLRAVTETATFPDGVGVAIGLVYAMSWLVWAARTPDADRLQTALHGLTAALVISPLIFEATSRFHAISSWTAGLLLFAFAVFGLAVSWRKELLIVATFATLAGLGTAGALIIATHDALPFTLVFLAIAAAVEVSACLNHWLSERWLTATAADLAVLLLTWLMTNEHGMPESYVPVSYSALLAAQVALLVIYLSSTIVRTLLRGFTMTWFETAQCAAAFLICVMSGRSPAFGVLCLVCAAACYLVAFRVLDVSGQRGRNFYTYSTFGILLVIAGSRILVSGMAASVSWNALAIAAMWAGNRFGRLTLQVHGGVYLLLGLAGSGALVQAGGLLLGAWSWSGTAAWPIWTGAVGAAVCCAIGGQTKALRIGNAAILVWLTAGVAAGLLTFGYHSVFGSGASHAFCATLRTTVIVGAALAVARAGEWSRLIYPLMLLGAWRLVMVDLYQDRKAALFLSLLIYGAALMVLPKLLRATSGRMAQQSAAPITSH
jgi:hypothetical protein